MKFLGALYLLPAWVALLNGNQFPFTIASIDTSFMINIVVTTGIGIISILIMFMTYVITRNRREISWTPLSDAQVVRVKFAVRRRIKIYFDDKPVSDLNLRLVTFRLRNSGDAPIPPDSFTGPITATFGTKAEVLDAEILDTTPSNVKSRVEKSFAWDTKKVLLGPVLLNSGDFLDVKVLLTGYRGEINVKDPGIIGVKKIVQKGVDPARMNFREYITQKSTIVLYFSIWFGYMIVFYGFDSWNRKDISLPFSKLLSYCIISLIVAAFVTSTCFLSSKRRSRIENLFDV